MSQPLNIKDILQLVDTSNKNFGTDVYIPSIKETVTVQSMTAKHLKDLINGSISNIFANTAFNKSIYNILNDILPDVELLKQYNIIDRVAILFQLRIANVGETINVELTNSKKLTLSETVNLKDIVENIRNTDVQIPDTLINDRSFEIVVGCPSIHRDYIFNNHFEKTKLKDIDQSDPEAIKELFGPLFISELVQYVKSIKSNEIDIAFDSLKLEDQILIVEKLPGSIINKIIESIDQVYGKLITEFTTVTKEFKKTQYTGKIQRTSLFN